METEVEDSEELEELDQDAPITVRQMKELLASVQENINISINKKIDEIKADVGQIKEHLENNNGRFDEMENRISEVEDKVINIDEVSTEVDRLRKTFENFMTQTNIDAMKARRNNMIIQGIPGKSKDTEVVMKTFLSFCKDSLKLSDEWIDKVDVVETYRFPSRNTEDKSWPLFVCLGKSRHREDIYKAAPNLKGTDISIKNDLAPCLQEERRKLIKESDVLQAKPYNYKTRMRNTNYKVWLEIRKPNSTDWKTWKGTDSTDM